MSDTNGSSSPNSHDAPASAEPRATEPDRPSERWIDRLMAAVGLKPSAAVLRENLETALERPDPEDRTFSPEERLLLRNILSLREVRVDDVMVTRAEIQAVDETVPLADLLLLFKNSGHSRMPVYRDSLDDAIGMVHIRDVMGYIAEHATVPASRVETRETEPAGIHLSQVDLSRPLAETDLIRPVLFVPGSMPAADLLARMQQSHIQMALVIDEFGGVDGLVSLEDIVEIIVGDIEDEHDVAGAEATIRNDGPGAWVADGRATLEDVSELLGIDLSAADPDEDIDTIGGLVFSLFGRVPRPGERQRSPRLPNLEFEVLDADTRRVRSVRIVETAPAVAASAGADAARA